MKVAALSGRGCRFAVIISLLAVAGVVRSAGLVMVNQAGYTPEAHKIAFINQAADSFYVVDAVSKARVLSGAVVLRRQQDAASGMDLYTADFSALTRPGRYTVIVPGAGTSAPFKVSPGMYRDLLQKSIKAFYYQRCGMELKPAVALLYGHPACHLQDGYFHSSTGLTGQAPGQGGWHDAGDYGKYIVNGGISAGTLLMAYETLPQCFAADTLAIPESGNGLPDLLDEVRYELGWFFTMQEADGGVHHKLTRVDFEPIIMPNKDTGKRYFMPLSSTAAGNFAAVLARAARLYRPFDPAFADSCLARAERTWSWLASHPTIVPATGFKNPAGVSTGEYGDGDDRDERLWAAAELWRTTRNPLYHRWYLDHYAALNLFTAEMDWGSVAPMAHLTYLLDADGANDAAVITRLRTALFARAAAWAQQREANGFGYLLKPGEYNWGSNSRALNRAILMVLAAELNNTPAWRQAALDQLHYMLGANPINLSFVSGVGSFAMKNPHHRPSWADNIPEPVPGLLAGGANQFLQDDALKARFNAATPPALCYVDHADSYASNEICINWNAPLVFLAGYFAADTATSTIGSRPDALPRQFRLGQNFPNPFNATTVIPFELEKEGAVTLQVYNSRGELVSEQDLGQLAAGSHSCRWQAGSASGIYWYRLRVDSAAHSAALTSKMAVVR